MTTFDSGFDRRRVVDEIKVERLNWFSEKIEPTEGVGLHRCLLPSGSAGTVQFGVPEVSQEPAGLTGRRAGDNLFDHKFGSKATLRSTRRNFWRTNAARELWNEPYVRFGSKVDVQRCRSMLLRAR